MTYHEFTMAKRRSKAQKNSIEPEQLRDTLMMTAREYIKTKEYQKAARKRWEQWLEPQRKHFEDMAKTINRIGVPQALERIKGQLASILRSPQIPREVFIAPRISESLSGAQLIEIISDRTAEKIFAKLKRGKTQQGMTIFLSEDGDLYRDPKEKYCYPMRKERKRLAILKSLGYSYKPTPLIRDQAGSSNSPTVRKEISVINQKTKIRLKLTKKLIEVKPFSGYRINPFYKIIRK